MKELKDYYIQDVMDMYKYLPKISRGGLSDFAPAIVTCAITGMQQSKTKNEYLPVTFEEQALSTEEAYKAGASMVHLHVRDQQNLDLPNQNPEDFLIVNKMIRERCPDIIINDTVAGGYLRLDGSGVLGKPYDIAKTSLGEVASVDVEGVGMGKIGEPNSAYTITPGEMDRLVDVLLEHGTKPAFECFDIGDFLMVNMEIATGKLGDGPFIVDMVVSPAWSYPSPSYLIEAMRYVPKNSIVTVIATGAGQFPILAVALAMGLNVRVGMEDNIYLERGVRAKTNAELVERVVDLAKLMGREIATPQQARQMYGLGEPRQYV